MKWFVTAQSAEGAEKLNEQGAVPVLALKGHCFTALPSFSLEEIKALQIPCAILMNRIYFERDLVSLQETLQQLKEIPVTDIYFQDPSVLYYAEDLTDKLVYKPETLAVSVQDVSFWKSRQICSVSVSPLLTAEETKEILSRCPYVEVTLFGHTLLSMSYRKLLSAYKAYGKVESEVTNQKSLTLKEEKREEFMPIFENEQGTLIYSDYVLSSFNEYAEFVKAGLNRAFLDSVYLDESVVSDALEVFSGEKTKAEFESRYSDLPLDEGYYAKKTVK